MEKSNQVLIADPIELHIDPEDFGLFDTDFDTAQKIALLLDCKQYNLSLVEFEPVPNRYYQAQILCTFSGTQENLDRKFSDVSANEFSTWIVKNNRYTRVEKNNTPWNC